MRIVALDLGEKSLGICISDSNQVIAIPQENYIFERFNFKEAVDRMNLYFDKYNDINLILIGYPLKTNGETVIVSEYVDEFIKLFKLQFSDIKIKKIDERFSTQRGIELLKKRYKDYDKIRELKDLAAAYVMLQDYLISR